MILVDAAFTSLVLPRRPRDAHKGNFGRAFLLCGSVGYVGAARLAAMGCLRAGAGLVCLGAPRGIYHILAASCPPEVMCYPLQEDREGRLSLDALPDIQDRLAWCDAALIGPGLGRSESLDCLVRLLCDRREAPLVVDADGLNALSGHRPERREAPLVLTPHEAEFWRLAGTGAGGAAAPTDFAESARWLAYETGAVVVRKGHATLTASPDGAMYVNTTGNPGMAKGGSGDLLAGFVTGLMAQKAAAPDLWRRVDVAVLVACAVYWHGLAGDLCAAELGEYAMTVTDIAAKLPAGMAGVANVASTAGVASVSVPEVG